MDRTLAHDDPDLVLPLAVTDEAIAEWHGWNEALDLPLLGELAACPPRRRRHAALKRRRPSILMRRLFGKMTDKTPVHKGEREIIARN